MVLVIVIVLAVLLVLGFTALSASVRVLREYERGVVFRLGRLMEQRGPGLQLLIPTIDRMVRVSLRTVTLTVPPQEIITRDNVPARVTAVAYYRVIDPNKAVTEVESFQSATLQIAQTTLRSVLGVADLDTLLSEREHLNESLAKVIDTQTEPWGIKVTMVEIKDVEIPERMQHAIARQAEPELGGGLELALGVDDLGAPLALGLGRAGDRVLHPFRDLDVLDLDHRDLDPPRLGLGIDYLLQRFVEMLAL